MTAVSRTHQVTNQPAPLVDYDVAEDATLVASVYDFGMREPDTKDGLVVGMSMTEKRR